MSKTLSVDDFSSLVRKSGLVKEESLDEFLANAEVQNGKTADDLAHCFIDAKLITTFQAKHLLKGRYKGFSLGRYIVEEQLGVGGMGAVFLARHRDMHHRVAIKLLPKQVADDPSALARFYREARAAASVNHPNVVRAIDIAEEAGKHFMVMEYVEGENLHEIVAREGPMPVAKAMRCVAQALNGLHHIHESALVHRDIKPANLILDTKGVIKVLDLGLACFQDNRKDDLTQRVDNNAVLGTADYMAPEQAMTLSQVDIRSDIYSTGAVLYFLLTGQAPFDGLATTQKLVAIQLRDPKPIATLRPDLPREVVRVVNKMMAKKQQDRYQTPAEAFAAVEPLSEPPAPSSSIDRDSSIDIKKPPKVKKKKAVQMPWHLWAIGGGSAAVVLAVVLAIALSGPSPNLNPQANLVQPPAFKGEPPRVNVPQLPNPNAPLVPIAAREIRKLGNQHSARLTIAPDGKSVLACGRDGTARIYDFSNGKLLKKFEGHTNVIYCGSFSSDGLRLATSGADGDIRIWDTVSSACLRTIPQAHKGTAWSVAWTPDNKQLFSGGGVGAKNQEDRDYVPRLWNAVNGDLVRSFPAHNDWINQIAVHPHGNAPFAASVGSDRWLRVWDYKSGKQSGSCQLKQGGRYVMFTRDGKHLLVSAGSGDAGFLSLHDARSGALIRQFQPLGGTMGAPYQVDISRDQKWVVSGGVDNLIHLWDMASGKELVRISGHTAYLEGVAFTPDNRHLITCSQDRTVRVWEIQFGPGPQQVATGQSR
ncbi:MAG: serine/threonine protein kinase [Gemmataceae bacterium]|nr:serine/threonine protein kinase [Gemmataceae bacterium]MCI0741595.1 serine/threonine protein kinase [Gemmataceae bacterium]